MSLLRWSCDLAGLCFAKSQLLHVGKTQNQRFWFYLRLKIAWGSTSLCLSATIRLRFFFYRKYDTIAVINKYIVANRKGIGVILNFNDFYAELLATGFSLLGGGSDEGMPNLVKFGWQEEPTDTPLRWHTGDAETDPWEWRVRVLKECNDIAYAKVFFKKGGYITKEWYPYFLAARRGQDSFEDAYNNGTISYLAKRIYDVVADSVGLPVHTIKQQIGFRKEQKSKFDAALTELQMKLYLTVCGEQQKNSAQGLGYAWPSMVFCTTEQFLGAEVFAEAKDIDAAEAIWQITKRILELNPQAEKKQIMRFIKG